MTERPDGRSLLSTAKCTLNAPKMTAAEVMAAMCGLTMSGSLAGADLNAGRTKEAFLLGSDILPNQSRKFVFASEVAWQMSCRCKKKHFEDEGCRVRFK